MADVEVVVCLLCTLLVAVVVQWVCWLDKWQDGRLSVWLDMCWQDWTVWLGKTWGKWLGQDRGQVQGTGCGVGGRNG